MTETVTLSRLLITGPLTFATPTIVIQEVAEAHGIACQLSSLIDPPYRQQVLELIKQTVPSTVPITPPKGKQGAVWWRQVARFVNCHVQWQREPLLEAFSFLASLGGRSEILSPPTYRPPASFDTGLQTPTAPHSLNATVLYALGKEGGVTFSSTTTLEELALGVQRLQLSSTALHRLVNLSSLTTGQLVTLSLQMPSHENISTPDPPIDTATLSSLERSLTNPLLLQKRLDPTSPAEAVALAALLYRFDLTAATDPLAEYHFMHHARSHGLRYEGLDPQLHSLLVADRNAFNMDINFNPLFPASYYGERTLRSMAQRAGYHEEDLRLTPPYELLQLEAVTPTFYSGKRLGIHNVQSPITMEEIADLPPTAILCYGVAAGGMEGEGSERRRGASSDGRSEGNGESRRLAGNFIAITYAELAELFTHNRSYLNPFRSPNEPPTFSDLSIRKLRHLCNANGTDAARSLNVAISAIEVANAQLSKEVRQFFLFYQQAAEGQRKSLQEVIRLLLVMGMAMRGWDGKGPYPIGEAPVHNQAEVDLRVTERIASFRQAAHSLGDTGAMVMRLPTYRYQNGEFTTSTSGNRGLTIGERIDVVMHDPTVRACIRTNSNYFVASAHRYLELLGCPPPFNIQQLRYIS